MREKIEDLDHREEAVKNDLRSLLTDDGSFIQIGEFGPGDFDLGCNHPWGIVGSEEEPEKLVSHSPSTGTPLRRSPRRAHVGADGSSPAPASTTRRRAFDSEDDDVPLIQFRQPPRCPPRRAAAAGPSRD